MTRAVLSGCLVGLLIAVASGDKLILTDGRTFTGTVDVEGDIVRITVPYGTLAFSRNQVERIELKDTPEQEFRKKLGEADLDDPNGLFLLARWAERNSLDRHASDLYVLILKLDPDHAYTRRALGYVRIGQKWLTVKRAILQARGRLEAGSYAALLDDVLPVLKEAAKTKRHRLEVAELLGYTQLRSRIFAAATRTFADLAEKADPPPSTRFAAIKEILTDNPDGMYVLRETYPASSPLLGGSSPSVQPGPASLANPLVLAAALRDLAKVDIAAGRKRMEEARKLERTDPDSAWQLYARAEQAFDRADALVDDITRSYRIEITRRKIAAIRRDVDADARKFEEAMGKLGLKPMSAQAFRSYILRMIHHLDSTRDNLQRIRGIAEPYSQELLLEMKWAELDLTTIEGLRKILVARLDEKK
jgi:hypothetical protein